MGLFDSFKAKQEEQRKKNPDNLPTQGQLTIRLLVGGYLYYLIYQIYTGGGLENRGWKLVIIVVAMLLFAGFGAYFLYNGIRAMMGHEYFDPNDFSSLLPVSPSYYDRRFPAAAKAVAS